MSLLAPNLGSPLAIKLQENVDFSQLYTDPFEGNPLWEEFAACANQVLHEQVFKGIDDLYVMRTRQTYPQILRSNIKMMGFNISLDSLQNVTLSGNFTYTQLQRLYSSLGTYWLTAGARKDFLNFLAYVVETQFTFLPLYGYISAPTTDQATINSEIAAFNVSNLTTAIPAGSSLIQDGGTYFLTPYYFAEYNPVEFPNLDEVLFSQLLNEIAPAHLVLQGLKIIQNYYANLYVMTAFETKEEHSFYAKR